MDVIIPAGIYVIRSKAHPELVMTFQHDPCHLMDFKENIPQQGVRRSLLPPAPIILADPAPLTCRFKIETDGVYGDVQKYKITNSGSIMGSPGSLNNAYVSSGYPDYTWTIQSMDGGYLISPAQSNVDKYVLEASFDKIMPLLAERSGLLQQIWLLEPYPASPKPPPYSEPDNYNNWVEATRGFPTGDYIISNVATGRVWEVESVDFTSFGSNYFYAFTAPFASAFTDNCVDRNRFHISHDEHGQVQLRWRPYDDKTKTPQRQKYDNCWMSSWLAFSEKDSAGNRLRLIPKGNSNAFFIAADWNDTSSTPKVITERWDRDKMHMALTQGMDMVSLDFSNTRQQWILTPSTLPSWWAADIGGTPKRGPP